VRTNGGAVVGKVTVFQYEILDPKVVERRLSRRWRTRAAIAGLKEMAEIVEASGTDIDEAVLDPTGFTPLNFDPRAP
jgi:hypothetical protein